MSLKNSFTDLLNVSDLKDLVIRLIEARVELKKLEVQEKLESLAANAVYWVVFLILAAVASVFLLILAAWGLNQWLGEPWGYVIILAVSLLLMGSMYGAARFVKEKIRQIIQREVDRIDN